MTAQASQTRIVNKAFVLLGTAQRIASLTDGSPLARQAAAVWDEARDEVLADHPWNFAIARAQLAASADFTPANEYSYAYELPGGDFLRWLPWREGHADHFEGEQEGGYILSNAPAPIYIRYIRRIEDVAKWSPAFTEAVAAKLAFYLADSVTARGGKRDRAEMAYDKALRDAKRQDGAATGDRRRRYETRSSWLDSRSTWNGG